MFRFLPYHIQLLTRTLSSNLGCFKNISRGHLSSYFSLKLGRHTTQQCILEVGTVKKIIIIFSPIVANIKNNYYYKICTYFNCQFSQIQWLNIPFLPSRILHSCPFPPLFGCLRITQCSAFSFPSRLSQQNLLPNEDA